MIDVLNRYLTEMSDAVLDHGGTLVAYMGDGLMAVFGAPLPLDDHADRAVGAAREMLHERLPRFNEWLGAEGYGDGFRMGVGLCSGILMSGNVGSERRLEYTTIGDTVNTASRIEGLTKELRHSVLVADSTRHRLRHQPPDLAFVERAPGARKAVEDQALDARRLLASVDGTRSEAPRWPGAFCGFETRRSRPPTIGRLPQSATRASAHRKIHDSLAPTILLNSGNSGAVQWPRSQYLGAWPRPRPARAACATGW